MRLIMELRDTMRALHAAGWAPHAGDKAPHNGRPESAREGA